MILLPPHLYKQYQAFCVTSGIRDGDFPDYLKWLRFFLDFCEKYQVGGDDEQRIHLFLDKLTQKGQSQEKQSQARHAVTLYLAMICRCEGGRVPAPNTVPPPPHNQPAELITQAAADRSVRKSFYNVAGYEEKSDSPEWDEVIEKLAAEIKVRHYSRKTLQTYAQWSRQFQKFLKNKPPQDLSTASI